MIVYKIWDCMNQSYINRFNKPNDVDWYVDKDVALRYTVIMSRAWKVDADNFEIHRFKLAMTRLR